MSARPDEIDQHIIASWPEWRSYLKGHMHCWKRIHPCKLCGETDLDLLTFHHRDPEQKRWSVGNFEAYESLDDFYAEMTKCDVLCKTCHRAEHGHIMSPRQMVRWLLMRLWHSVKRN